MTPHELAGAYLAALSDGDLGRILDLFAPNGMVRSPMYGPMAAAEFYPAVLADTSASHLTLRGVTTGQTAAGVTLVNVWFHYDWRLASGLAAPFDVVDVLELDEQGRVAVLHIVYDTVDVRQAYEEDTGHTSWRAARD
ncbi:nuclear transport factor 2 family protein [Sphaerisporangium dianthi]|uniref:Nuclear transport factor 2 family protein n=1 Tax=Sphaerisporangium dianthi TaxID=1436120 RepID=A0ABV9CR29_9ACTN